MIGLFTIWLDEKVALDSQNLFESILYVDKDVWSEKYKKDVEDYPHACKMKYITCSNKEGCE